MLLGEGNTMSVDMEKWDRKWRAEIPKPLVATHGTPNEKAIGILEAGRIIAELGVEGVSMSMDQHLWGEPPDSSIFVFNLGGLMSEVPLIPNFYLLPEFLAVAGWPSLEFERPPSFKVNAWPMVSWAEINSGFQDVSLKHLKYLVSWSPEVRKIAEAKNIQIQASVESTAFSEVMSYWHKQINKYLGKRADGPVIPPPYDIEDFLSSYNSMVTDLFNIDINEVKAVAKDWCVRHDEPVWWEK